MREILRRPVLNPAFKRFQYLPHLPAGSAAKHGCAAPTGSESRSQSDIDANFIGDRKTDLRPEKQPGAQIRQAPCEFESPL
jgi:hypothetical protein